MACLFLFLFIYFSVVSVVSVVRVCCMILKYYKKSERKIALGLY